MQLDSWKSMVFKSSRKKLIAIGCSYTHHYTISVPPNPNVNFDFTRWPEHLSNMLDMECINLGRCGSGNEQILAKTVDVVLNEKNIGLIVLMWSEWQRIDFQRHDILKNTIDEWYMVRPHTSSGDQDDGTQLVDENFKKRFLRLANPKHATRQTLRQFIHAEKLLRDLPYLFIQGTFNLPFYSTTTLDTIECFKGGPDFLKVNDSRRKAASEIIRSPYLDYIEKNIGDKFIGWPIMHEIGGYSIDNILDKEDPERLKYRISEDDSHPNAAGHKFIADFLYEQYKEIYSVQVP